MTDEQGVIQNLDSKKRKQKKFNWLAMLFIVVISVILCIPVFIIVYRYMPVMMIGSLRIDHFVTFLPLLAIVTYIVAKFKMLMYVLGSAALVWLTVMGVTGRYTIKDVYYDYSAMLYALGNGAVPITFLEEKKAFTNEDKIKAAIDVENVRPYAVDMAKKNFREYYNVAPGRTIVQAFSVFKEIYTRWVYVHDPQDQDYYAKASETMAFLKSGDGTFAGDCDDYSIFMAACIKAIGGEVRLVRTRIDKEDGTSIGHLYPEVYIGDKKDLESATYLIKNKLFTKWSQNKDIFYYEDEDGKIWLNFDYNDAYPGGKYQSTLRVSVLELNKN